MSINSVESHKNSENNSKIITIIRVNAQFKHCFVLFLSVMLNYVNNMVSSKVVIHTTVVGTIWTFIVQRRPHQVDL